MEGLKWWVVLLCSLLVVSCASQRASCRRDRDCDRRRGERCAYMPKTESNVIRYIPCSRRNSPCECRKVCRRNNRYIIRYFDGCNWCFCVNTYDNSFGCTRIGCPLQGRF